MAGAAKPAAALNAAFEHAVALHRDGQLSDAARAYESVLQADPAHFGATHALGVIYLQHGLAEQSERQLALAIRIDPKSAAAHRDRGRALRALGRTDDAIASFDAAITLEPDHPAAHYQRGNALLENGRAADALVSFDAAIAGNPQHFQALNNRGNALRALDRIEDAIASYDAAIGLKPGLAVARLNRASALQDLGRFAEAFDAYNQAIALKPDFHGAYRGRGTLNLLLGRMREGFADFEHRLQTEEATLHARLQRVPYWQGEDLAGKSILVYGDGAFGDLLQFCRYLPLLIRAGAQVTLIVPAAFRKILEPALGDVRVISTVEHIDRPDLRCELMSLPFLLNTDLASIPACIDLRPVKSLPRKPWLAGLKDKSLNVGICWQGNPARDIDHGRSIPLIEFHPLSQISGIRLVSLQKLHGLEQLRSLPSDMPVETCGADFDAGTDAFVDTAAVMAELDLIVTSDTAVAHLAAALGLPTWIALKFVPEWRWMLGRNDSPWYPTVRLFRQRELYRWAPVFEDIAGALSEVAERKAANRGAV